MEKSKSNFNDCVNKVDTTKDDKIDQLNLQKCLDFSEAMVTLRNENIELKKKLLLSDQKSQELQKDIQILMTLAQNAGQSLNSTRSSVVSLSDDLARPCTVNGVPLDHKNGDLSFENHSLSTTQSQLKSEIHTSRPHVFENLQALSDAVEIKKYVNTISDQIKYLKTAVEHTIELNKDKVSDLATADKDTKEEIADLYEQIDKLKSLLWTKREQIVSMLSELKSAKVALMNQRSKYEKEKLTSREAISQLQDELKILKEEAAAFSKTRAMFAVRCEEYGTQVHELTHQLTAADNEKKTLQKFLQLTIRQKLELARILEMER